MGIVQGEERIAGCLWLVRVPVFGATEIGDSCRISWKGWKGGVGNNLKSSVAGCRIGRPSLRHCGGFELQTRNVSGFDHSHLALTHCT